MPTWLVWILALAAAPFALMTVFYLLMMFMVFVGAVFGGPPKAPQQKAPGSPLVR